MDLSRIADNLPFGPTVLVAIAIALGVLVIAGIVALVFRRRRRRRLHERFGPEYDHAVERADGRRVAERELQDREQRRAELDLRPLDVQERERFRERWDAIQRDFVDAPIAALQRADALLQEVQRARGYPAGDLERRIADLSVDHAHLVGSYRRLRNLLDRDQTPPLTAQRDVLLEVRTLFDALLRPDRDREREPAVALASSGNGHNPDADRSD